MKNDDKPQYPPSPIQNDKLSQDIWNDPALGQALHQLRENKNKQQKTIPYWLTAMAACTILAVTLTMFMTSDDPVTHIATAQVKAYITAISEQQDLTLTDGSLVNLNAQTAIDVHLTQNKRLITLSRGEAYFDVVSNKDLPFEVKTRYGTVEVLGTEFNLDQDDDGIDVRVYEGKVKVTDKHGKQIIITQGQRVFMNVNGSLDSVQLFDSIQKEDWMSGMLHAKNMTLKRIVNRLNRYSETPLYLAPGIGSHRVTGSFALSDISESISLLSELYDLDVIKSGDSLYLQRNK